MSGNRAASELTEKIKKLEQTIAKLERETRRGMDDQLFFGLIISLLVFLLTLSLDDVALLFQNNVGLNADIAWKTSEGIRNIGLLALIASSATRYYTALVGEKVSKRFRLYSLQCLFIGWNAVLLILLVNVSLNASLNLGSLNFPVAGIVLAVTYFFMQSLEKKTLIFYASKELIFKKDVTPYISNAFLLVAGGFNLAIAAIYLLIMYGVKPSPELFFLLWLLFPIVVILLRWLAEHMRSRSTRKAKTSATTSVTSTS